MSEAIVLDDQKTLNNKKVINGWAMFDWANSSYNLVISTAVFPPFFSAMAPDYINFIGMDLSSTSMYSFAVGFSFLFAALLSYLLSGLADYSGKQVIFLKIFTVFGALFCGLLFLFQSEAGALFALIAFSLATVGFTSSQVFYNALLPVIATEEQYDHVSAKGYAYGYVGSVILLIFILGMIQFPAFFGIESTTLAPRIGFVLVGLWWLGFAQITFKRMPKDRAGKLDLSLVKQGQEEIKSVFKKILKNKNIRRYLYSFFFFTAGVYTVIYLASIFAQDILHFDSGELILLILLLQLVAVAGAYLFAYISKLYGNKLTLMIQIFIWFAICIAAYFTTGKTFFYVLAGFVGLVMGGIQPLARSTYSKMVDQNKAELNSYFSFYDILSKVSVVMGTILFGVINQLTGNMRYSVLAIGLLFVVGFFIMKRVDTQSI